MAATSNFQAWLNEADMPTKNPDGSWYDAETGHAYNPAIDYAIASKPKRNTLSARAADARQLAKMFGGKALTGSAKQKEWAEKIRAEKIMGEKVGTSMYDPKDEMSEDMLALVCDPDGLGKAAKFWIENRHRKPSEIGAFFMEQKALLRQAQSLRAAGKSDEYAAVAAQYNTLTAQWGF